MVKKSEVVVLPAGFDYTRLEPQVAGEVQATAERIRLILKKTLEDLIAIGSELQAVKGALEHGQFGRWLQAEFGWTERLAQNFMTVAERFGPKSEIISDLQIQPTAAYLLAAPSVPDEARQHAIERAQAGERITTKVAKEIVTKSRKKLRRKRKPLALERFLKRLVSTLEKHKERLPPKDVATLARNLREIADELEHETKAKNSG